MIMPGPATSSVNLVYNEKTKLTASWLSTLGAAAIAAGVFAPFVASVTVPGYSVGWGLVTVSGIWLLTGIALHLVARRLLGGLKS
jgi:hypothetical protein